MSDQQNTTNEGAEVLRVYAENERRCGRFGLAKDLNDAADEIDRLRSALGKIARRYPADTAENMVRFARDTLGDGWRDA